MPVELDPEEREVLVRGLWQWGGPASATTSVAALAGFSDARTMHVDARRLADEIEGQRSLSPADWRRALTATEIVFASDRYGAGVEWEMCTGLSDAHTIGVLRRLQRKLISVR